jgi:hypothetical protein
MPCGGISRSPAAAGAAPGRPFPCPRAGNCRGSGTYNYDQETGKSSEHGLYRLRFQVPAAWQARRIWLVFEGAMTDTGVKVNGRSAGPVHQGGFCRFRYDVTKLLKDPCWTSISTDG